MFALNNEDIFNNIIMSKEPENRSFFIDIPNNHTLIIGTGDKGFIIRGSGKFPHPALVSMEGFFAEPSTNFPQLDSFVSGTGEQVITSLHKLNIRNIVLMTIESFTTLIIIVTIP